MEEEQYCLKWNNHQSTLLTVLTGLMDSERLADCVLSADGRMLKAHQVVLSACSPYLEKLLNDSRQPGLQPILVFSDLTYEELLAMKEYMYKGEVNIRQDALDSFLKAASALQVKGLAEGGSSGPPAPDDTGGGGGRHHNSAPSSSTPVAPESRRRRRRESRESDSIANDNSQDTLTQQAPPVKKQNVFSAKVEPFEPTPVVKMEPVVDQGQVHHQASAGLMMKAEPQDQGPEPETHDLTGLDDDEEYDYEMPGTSQPDLSQDMSNWQMENSMNSEEFAAVAASQQQQMNASQPGQSSQGHYVCESCGRSYKHRKTLVRHRNLECGKTATISCPHCTYKCKLSFNMKSHINVRHNPMATVYSCSFCGFNTKRKESLKLHEASKHFFSQLTL